MSKMVVALGVAPLPPKATEFPRSASHFKDSRRIPSSRPTHIESRGKHRDSHKIFSTPIDPLGHHFHDRMIKRRFVEEVILGEQQHLPDSFWQSLKARAIQRRHIHGLFRGQCCIHSHHEPYLSNPRASRLSRVFKAKTLRNRSHSAGSRAKNALNCAKSAQAALANSLDLNL
jgi:hypothetical protein